MSENENRFASNKLPALIDALLKKYEELQEKVERLENEIKEKNRKISELEEKLIEKELTEEDIVAKLENALNNSGI